MTITGWLPETLFIALPAAGLGIGFVLGRRDAAYSGYGVLDGALAETAVMVAEWEAIHHQADESYPQELSGAAETTGELFLADQLAQAEDFRQWIDDWPPIEDVRGSMSPKGGQVNRVRKILTGVEDMGGLLGEFACCEQPIDPIESDERAWQIWLAGKLAEGYEPPGVRALTCEAMEMAFKAGYDAGADEYIE